MVDLDPRRWIDAPLDGSPESTLPAVRSGDQGRRGSEDGDSLAESKKYKDTIDGLDDDRIGQFYVDLKPFIEQSLKSDPEAAKQLEQVRSIFPIDKLDPIAGALLADEDRIAFDSITHGPGVKALRALGPLTGTGSTPLLAELPGDAWVALGAADVGPSVKSIFTKVAGALGEQERRGRVMLPAMSVRYLLDSISARLDESRDISRYQIGLLIFLGLLGTFWGLLETIGSVSQVINGLSVGEGDLVVEPVEGLSHDHDVDGAVVGRDLLGRRDLRTHLGHLLAQDRDLRPDPPAHVRGGDVVGGVERGDDDEPRVVVGTDGQVLLLRARGVVAEQRHPRRDLVPGLRQV